jgi:hypothetical protein
MTITKKKKPMYPHLPKRRENRGVCTTTRKHVSCVSASSNSPNELDEHYNSPHSTISIFNFGVWPETGTFSIFRTLQEGKGKDRGELTNTFSNQNSSGKTTYCQHAGRIQYFAEHTMLAIQKVGLAGRDEKLATYDMHQETTFCEKKSC